MAKPLHILKAGLSGRYYATRSVRQLTPTHMVCTGPKEDVTDQIEAICQQAVDKATKGLVEALEYADLTLGNVSMDYRQNSGQLAQVKLAQSKITTAFSAQRKGDKSDG